jgi:hypothetical protein
MNAHAPLAELARMLLEPSSSAALPQSRPEPRAVDILVTRADAMAAGGTADLGLNNKLVREAISACVGPDGDVQTAAAEALAALRDIGPNGVRESMLAVQLLATHCQTLESFRLAQCSTGPVRAWHLSSAARLSRSHALLSEALDRLRSRDSGERLIVIEHRHLSSSASLAAKE